MIDSGVLNLNLTSAGHRRPPLQIFLHVGCPQGMAQPGVAKVIAGRLSLEVRMSMWSLTNNARLHHLLFFTINIYKHIYVSLSTCPLLAMVSQNICVSPSNCSLLAKFCLYIFLCPLPCVPYKLWLAYNRHSKFHEHRSCNFCCCCSFRVNFLIVMFLRQAW